MSPDEVIEKLKKLGVDMSRQTLTRYERQGLIPTPKRGSTGRGGGRWTNYPDEAVAEAYASCLLLHGDCAKESLEPIFCGKPPKISPNAICLTRKIYFARTQMLEAQDKMDNFRAAFGDTRWHRINNFKEVLENHEGALEKHDELYSRLVKAQDIHHSMLSELPEEAQIFLRWLSVMWGCEAQKASELLKTLE